MKKWAKILVLIGVSLMLCVCVGVAVYARTSWCRVTFVCEEGCTHKTWCRIGETADTSVVVSAHQEEKVDKQIAGVYKDEKRLINYLSEPLCKTKTTLYVGEWKNTDMHDIWFFTPYGTIVMYVDFDDCWGNATQNISKMKTYFMEAFAALGGDADNIDEDYYFQGVTDKGPWVFNVAPLHFVMEAIHTIYIPPEEGGDPYHLSYPCVLMVRSGK